jgi:hypothetical protein
MNGPGEDRSGFFGDLGDAVGRHPISATLIGMGALWLLSGQALKNERARPIVNRASEALGPLGSGLRSGIQSAAPDWEDFDANAAGDAVSDIGSRLTEIFRRQPLALGVIGLAIGAGIAASLPMSEKESELLGEASGEFKDRAQEFAAEQAERAKDRAKRAVDAAADEARNQGLSQEGIKSTAQDLSQKLERVFEAAKGAAADRAKVP